MYYCQIVSKVIIVDIYVVYFCQSNSVAYINYIIVAINQTSILFSGAFLIVPNAISFGSSDYHKAAKIYNEQKYVLLGWHKLSKKQFIVGAQTCIEATRQPEKDP